MKDNETTISELNLHPKLTDIGQLNVAHKIENNMELNDYDKRLPELDIEEEEIYPPSLVLENNENSYKKEVENANTPKEIASVKSRLYPPIKKDLEKNLDEVSENRVRVAEEHNRSDMKALTAGERRERLAQLIEELKRSDHRNSLFSETDMRVGTEEKDGEKVFKINTADSEKRKLEKKLNAQEYINKLKHIVSLDEARKIIKQSEVDKKDNFIIFGDLLRIREAGSIETIWKQSKELIISTMQTEDEVKAIKQLEAKAIDQAFDGNVSSEDLPKIKEVVEERIKNIQKATEADLIGMINLARFDFILKDIFNTATQLYRENKIKKIEDIQEMIQVRMKHIASKD